MKRALNNLKHRPSLAYIDGIFVPKNLKIMDSGHIDYYFAYGPSQIPPEALNGIADGETIKANITASILLGRSLSLNGTIFYLDNLRYNKFFKIQGEIRAHF